MEGRQNELCNQTWFVPHRGNISICRNFKGSFGRTTGSHYVWNRYFRLVESTRALCMTILTSMVPMASLCSEHVWFPGHSCYGPTFWLGTSNAVIIRNASLTSLLAYINTRLEGDVHHCCYDCHYCLIITFDHQIITANYSLLSETMLLIH